jgi:hypothetical protein
MKVPAQVPQRREPDELAFPLFTRTRQTGRHSSWKNCLISICSASGIGALSAASFVSIPNEMAPRQMPINKTPRPVGVMSERSRVISLAK